MAKGATGEMGAPAPAAPSAAEGGRDSGLAILAIGILAYVGETMLHEAVGHGGLCLATGGRVTLLDPLGMRCSVVAPAMVSGAAGFGNWAVLAAPLAPAWAWRAALVLAGIALYYGFRRLLAVEYARMTGPSGAVPARLRRLVLLPTAAAVVALAAASLSPTGRATALELAFGCTVVVGASLLGLPGLSRPPHEPAPAPARITGSVPLAIAALVIAAAFIAIIGPGVDLSGF